MVRCAAVAQQVERELPKLEVAGSRPVRRLATDFWGIPRRMGLVGNIARRTANRSRWLAERLWFIAAAEVAWVSWGHWRRLDSVERNRLVQLARKSRGRPARNLSAAERREAEELLDKLGHIEFAGSVARTVLPFRPLSRSAQWAVEHRHRRRRKKRAAQPE